MRKFNITSLSIEIIRGCNMDCVHCLRGDSEFFFKPQMDDFSILPRIFDGVKSVDTLVITGGEPTLNVNAIEKIVDYIIENRINVNGIYIATNGMIYSQEMVDAVWRLFCYNVDRKLGNRIECCNGKCGDDIRSAAFVKDSLFEDLKYNFGIAVSADEFHDPIPAANYVKYLASGFYVSDKEVVKRRYPGEGVISRGFGFHVPGAAEMLDPDPIYLEDPDDDLFNVIFVDLDGNVFGDCNLSYDMMENIVDNYNNSGNKTYYNVNTDGSLGAALERALKEQDMQF